MKKIGSIGVAVLMTLSVGCNNKVEETVQVPAKEVVEEIEKQEEVNKFVEADFQGFLTNYFSFTDDELLILNQQYETINERYWDHLQEEYRSLINQKLNPYLSDSLKDRLNSQFVHEEIDVPKFILMNNYVVSGHADVEKVEIKSTRAQGEKNIYEVAVTTVNKCYPANEFEQMYSWGEEEEYFIEKQEGVTADPLEFSSVNLEKLKEQDYMFTGNVLDDEMKLEQNLWITVLNQKEFKVDGIKSATSWGVATEDKNSVLDSQYVNRLPYEELPTEEEQILITTLFKTLFSQPKSVYAYLELAYDTSAETFAQVFEELGFKYKFYIFNESYKTAYSKEINPYKDEIDSFKISSRGIKVTPSVYSTKYQPRFVVTVPVEALHSNNQVVYYNYKYYVGMEEESIEMIQFMGMKPSDEYDYRCGMNEVELIQVAQEFSVDKDALAQAAQDVNMTVEELIDQMKEGDHTNPVAVAESIQAARKANNENTVETAE